MKGTHDMKQGTKTRILWSLPLVLLVALFLAAVWFFGPYLHLYAIR